MLWHRETTLALLFVLLILPRAGATDTKTMGKIGTASAASGCSVYQIVFSPDGKTLAVRYQDHGLRLWDTAAGKELTTLQRKDVRGWIDRIIDFSANGKTLLTHEKEHAPKPGWSLYHWDIASGKGRRIFELGGHPQALPDRKTLAVRAWDGTGVSINDSESGKEQRRLNLKALSADPARQGYEFMLSFNLASNGKTLLCRNTWETLPSGRLPTRSLNTTCHVVDVATGKEVSRLATTADMESEHWAECCGVSPDGKTVVSCTGAIWDATTGKVRGAINMGELNNYGWGGGWLFTPDGKGILTANADGIVREWDIVSGKETRQFKDPTHKAHCLAHSPDGKVLASGGQDGVIFLWSLEGKRP